MQNGIFSPRKLALNLGENCQDYEFMVDPMRLEVLKAYYVCVHLHNLHTYICTKPRSSSSPGAEVQMQIF